MTTCFSTYPADPPCTGWVAEGHPFHGCKHPEHHMLSGPGGVIRFHECHCGLRWTRRNTVLEDAT